MSDTLITRSIELDSREEAVQLCGPRDQHLKPIRDSLGVMILPRGTQLEVRGEADQAEYVEQAGRALGRMRDLLRQQERLDADDVLAILQSVRSGGLNTSTKVAVADNGRHLRPRTPGQERYVRALKNSDVVFAIGPAGSGKTFLAVAMAVSWLKSGAVKKIILVRPAVEAGERLGFLPGDLVAKINPYLRPLFDSLSDLMDPIQVKRYLDNDIIEICPLAYMRGRTLSQAAIILDEGQNATVAQMKMFLTRMGHGSKIIVTGDVTQTDLPPSMTSGLTDAVRRLSHVPGLEVVKLYSEDIVRNPLVQKIVDAYEGEDREAFGAGIEPRE